MPQLVQATRRSGSTKARAARRVAATFSGVSIAVVATLMAPYMSCGARLTVYALFAAAFFPRNGQNVVFLLYIIGIALAILTGFVLRRFMLSGPVSPFILELPPYHLPTLKNLLIRTWQRLQGFVLRAGKAIVAVVLVLNEVNRLFEYPVIYQEFLPLLRSWYQEAKCHPILQKLRFVLIYSTEICVSLHLNQSPFNIGLPVELRDLTLEEIQRLAALYELPEEVALPLRHLVGGRPYLIQLGLYHLSNHPVSMEEFADAAATPRQ